MRFEPLIALGASLGVASASSSHFHAADYNKPDGGPPTSWFSGASSIPVSKVAAAAAAATKVPADASFIMHAGGHAKATIKSDWASLPKGAAYVWVADMDVDCDGLDEKCTGNTDGQKTTNWGHLASYEVPWIVIPNKFYEKNKHDIKPNNVAAVICDGKLFYGVFADTDGDNPEEIGEASWLFANSCFPQDHLNGGKGHVHGDVTYIVFTGEGAKLPSSAINDHYVINFDTLKTMGDEFMNDLVQSLNL